MIQEAYKTEDFQSLQWNISNLELGFQAMRDMYRSAYLQISRYDQSCRRMYQVALNRWCPLDPPLQLVVCCDIDKSIEELDVATQSVNDLRLLVDPIAALSCTPMTKGNDTEPPQAVMASPPTTTTTTATMATKTDSIQSKNDTWVDKRGVEFFKYRWDATFESVWNSTDAWIKDDLKSRAQEWRCTDSVTSSIGYMPRFTLMYATLSEHFPHFDLPAYNVRQKCMEIALVDTRQIRANRINAVSCILLICNLLSEFRRKWARPPPRSYSSCSCGYTPPSRGLKPVVPTI